MPYLSDLLRQLGRIIRILRSQAGYSQERFGFAIGVHRTYMGHLERGTANPTVKTLHLVAQGLGMTVPELFTFVAQDSAGRPGADTGQAAATPTASGAVILPPRQAIRGRSAQPSNRKEGIAKRRR
jgi:transcriptional regulator with XRE-family HTH domain